ncbi:SDR family NAD(P)-dependent oxidoreductase [Cohnella rhizosphaerae]|uniref:SDR family NAD(P)-dependent oxidoreductase n=1 Tax=Cohnella rhizosphaerae TaxID=1457232 RepID=A0A9X4KSS2_9BACL|nr:SDR family NAD(P)-dependent oxidoreductase [Cohnella rhizosphaerae]MDG0810033.1 SDR family NAD(P)-dependent oxidoreductase [Cohnella rhizosphaerae]
MLAVDLSGQSAIVTGAAAGIGYVIASALAGAGAAVTLADLSEEGEEKARLLRHAGRQALFVRTDATTETDVLRLADSAAAAFGGRRYTGQQRGDLSPGRLAGYDRRHVGPRHGD